MATNTYVALKSGTITGSTVSYIDIDLTGITGYTDLRVVMSGGYTYTDCSAVWQFNGDTTSSYSYTFMYGQGTSAGGSYRGNNQANTGNTGWYPYPNTASTQGISIVDIMNFSNTNVYKTILIRNGVAVGGVWAGTSTWRKTEAITSIKVDLGSYNNPYFTVGSTYTVYGIANADNFVKATGGIISEDSTYTYHVFGASGTFTPKQSLTADVLVVAGGGAGGASTGGGGGAGGLCYQASRSLTSGTPLTVTVGAGGAAGAGAGSNGGNSVFDTITALGGGGGNYGPYAAGSNGGSGGGGGESQSGGSATQGTSGGATGYGNAGATGPNSSPYRHGGGGGAGSAGVSGSSTGDGGAGLNTWSSWAAATSTGDNGYYAGGGGGGSNSTTFSPGGLGGGGIGSGTSNAAGLANTGGGGGGAGSNAPSSRAGGSGIVIIRYPK